MYKLAALGGTFDRLHVGHAKLLDLAFLKADNVVIGLTVDGFSGEKDWKQLILPYSDRSRELKEYLQAKGYGDRFRIIKLDDMYGETITNKDIDLLVVSTETVSGGNKVNQKRVEMGWGQLPLEVASLVVDQNGKQVIASGRVRAGEISRSGLVYKNLFNQEIVVDDVQKQILKEPMGRLILSEEEFEPEPILGIVAVVGDVSLGRFVSEDWIWNIGVFDGKSQRQIVTGDRFGVVNFECTNETSKIEAKAVSALMRAIEEKKSLISVTGEEDLLVLPLILLLPLNSLVYYGQPDQGLVEVKVTEENKQKWYEFLAN